MWDGENRLRQITYNGTTEHFDYDYMGRRIRRTSPQDTHFHYDGWNLIALSYATSTPVCTYTWGTDLSGTMGGAGGVGGLLVTKAAGTDYYPLYDANGNACQYIDGSGNYVARYEYDAFGRMTYKSPDTWSDNMLHRFSTKIFDTGGTGLYDYGYRFYNTVLGRWLKRDPIGELGGANLYNFIGNDGANGFDLLGLIDGSEVIRENERVAYHKFIAQLHKRRLLAEAGKSCPDPKKIEALARQFMESYERYLDSWRQLEDLSIRYREERWSDADIANLFTQFGWFPDVGASRAYIEQSAQNNEHMAGAEGRRAAGYGAALTAASIVVFIDDATGTIFIVKGAAKLAIGGVVTVVSKCASKCVRKNGSGTIAETSRRRAMDRAQEHAQVPRTSRGGETIGFDDLNTQGANSARIRGEGATNRGRRDTNSSARFEDHPDGHPTTPGPEHHDSPHVHGVNRQGEEIIVTYPAGS